MMQRHAFGLPGDCLQSVAVADHNIHSPVLSRLMRSGQPQFFSIELPALDVDCRWAAAFAAGGWRRILALGRRVAESEDDVVATFAGFYDVAESCSALCEALQEAVMPQVHARLQALAPARSTGEAAIHLTPMQRRIGQLLAAGRTNKEIGRILERSDYTVKQHVSNMLQEAGVSNRTELAALLLRQSNA